MNKLTIVDGNSLLFRAYYASAYAGTTIMRTKDGVPTNAIYIFANMIVRVLSDLQEGDGLLVAFDTGGKTFRHDQFEAYKAQRKKAPEELITQMPIAREFLRSLGIYTIEIEGYEADDIAGSAAFVAHEKGHAVALFTSDRDFLQLVNTTIKVQLIKKGMSDIRVMDSAKVIEEFGITPAQIPDYKGLCGDASDNLPGIPGVGDKTAVKLLQQYGSFEAIVAAAASIGGKVGSNLVAHQALGAMCKELAIIKTDIALPFTLADTIYPGYDHEAATAFGARYELKTFLTKLPAAWRRHTATAAIEVTAVTDLSGFIPGNRIGLFIDRSEANYHKATIYGLAISNGRRTVYLPIEAAIKDKHLATILASSDIEKCVHDLKALRVVFARYGLHGAPPFFDALLAAYTLDTATSAVPEALLALYGASFPQAEAPSLFENGNPRYAGHVAHNLARLTPKIRDDLRQKDALNILLDVEQPLAIVLADMEREGVPVDEALLMSFGATFKAKVAHEIAAIHAAAGHEFNINSPKQVAAVLFDELKLPASRKLSTSADILKSLTDLHPIVAHLLEHRKYAKLLSTYVESLVGHIHPDGKFHAMFNQATTSTGRLSSVEPNLQNIAVRDEEGRIVRRAFHYPQTAFKFVSFDYSQIELRILAHLAACPALIDVFNRDEDIHTATARALFASGGNPTSTMRRKAKAVNFGIIYGISDWGLSEQLDIPNYEAKDIIKAFYETYPEVRAYMNALVQSVQTAGFVTTLTGRRRYLREIHDSNYQRREFAKRAAMNAPIQGTAADLIKLAMIRVAAAIEDAGLQSKMILQIHDELLFKAPAAEVDQLIALVTPLMENALPLNVKLQVVASVGDDWYELKE